ncbi:MAG: hypothetical protein Fur0015_13230 [Ignavibacteriales bacterium]
MRIKFFIFFLAFVSILNAQPEYYSLKNYANDFTGTLTENELSTLNRELKIFDDSTSTQIVFLMINSLNGYPIEMYSQELAEKNGIGSKKNNGVLLLVSLNDKKIRIEVGYGLEGALTDALSNSIIRNEIAPHFREGDYYSGVVAGLNAIIKATQGEYKDKKKDDGGGGKFPFWIIILIFIIISGLGRGRGGGLGSILLWGALTGSGRSGGFSGGSFGGGGFGGFSGGGGSFGGGGSSGSW